MSNSASLGAEPQVQANALILILIIHVCTCVSGNSGKSSLYSPGGKNCLMDSNGEFNLENAYNGGRGRIKQLLESEAGTWNLSSSFVTKL